MNSCVDMQYNEHMFIMQIILELFLLILRILNKYLGICRKQRIVLFICKSRGHLKGKNEIKMDNCLTINKIEKTVYFGQIL